MSCTPRCCSQVISVSECHGFVKVLGPGARITESSAWGSDLKSADSMPAISCVSLAGLLISGPSRL